MKEQDQIKAIAELDGYTNIVCPVDKQTKHSYQEGYEELYGDIELYKEVKLGKYLTSRDAIVPVIEKQDDNVQLRIAAWLAAPDCDTAWSQDAILAIIKATPSKLAEALLRVTGKWKD